ncbi:LacI family DNA-binding transcriptional regulator [Georgenia thermotolerans]|uniref:Substrate-binding domain-containing protein n=1 Tax=Georgenia thermotolerans TaxID=527326 RepID=A0A7J5UJ72_9MICO|nr:LacI family DNA-binding transcriptional regulator [Georgenia thermotolerans]KAE8762445.1 substrate-binding domain-containing protein [Georgenia thermotolerans]
MTAGNATVRDVAARAKVSLGTVSNVLNRPEAVSPGTLQRVHEAIDALGFVPNDAARRLRTGRSRSVGLVVLDVGNPFFTDLARGAEAAVEAAGGTILLGDSDHRPEREARYLDLFEEQRVRGVLVSPVDGVSHLDELSARGTPTVLVDRAADPARFCSTSVDDVAGGRLAAGHLLEQGYRRLAFVGGPLRLRQMADRLRGAREAVAAAGGALEVVELAEPTAPHGRVAGADLAARPVAHRPEAVLAGNDLIAAGVLQALMLDGVRVPEDVGVVGYDDTAPAQTAVVPLSSVRRPSELLGRTAVELLLEEAAGGEHRHRRVVFEPELVVRGSSVRG